MSSLSTIVDESMQSFNVSMSTNGESYTRVTDEEKLEEEREKRRGMWCTGGISIVLLVPAIVTLVVFWNDGSRSQEFDACKMGHPRDESVCSDIVSTMLSTGQSSILWMAFILNVAMIIFCICLSLCLENDLAKLNKQSK